MNLFESVGVIMAGEDMSAVSKDGYEFAERYKSRFDAAKEYEMTHHLEREFFYMRLRKLFEWFVCEKGVEEEHLVRAIHAIAGVRRLPLSRERVEVSLRDC